jgi:hypothetical protein
MLDEDTYGEVFALVHFVCTVLASGASGAVSLPNNLAAIAAFPHHWNCCRRSAGAYRLYHPASGAASPKNLKHNLSFQN